MGEERKDRENSNKKRREGSLDSWAAGLTAAFLQRHTVSCFVSVLFCLHASFLLPSVSLSHLYFYHRGNWPTHLLVVGGSGGGICTSGIYCCIVWFYSCLIAPYCLIGGQQKTLQRMVCASWKVCLLCCPSCLCHSLLMVRFVSGMHMAESPRRNWYAFFSLSFSQGPYRNVPWNNSYIM